MTNIRVCIDIPPHVLEKLIEQYGDVQQLLRTVAIQIAENADPQSIHVFAKYIDIYTLLDKATHMIRDIVQDVRQLYKIPLSSPLADVYRTLVSLKVKLIYDMLKRVKKQVPPTYRRIVKQLEEELFRALIEGETHDRT